MGHDFIKYEGSHERFHDFDLWVLRHFFVKESRALETAKPSLDTPELRKFFESWDWLCPGVVTGTDFSQLISGSHARWRLALDLLQKAGDRIAEFGEQIPLPYLEAHINRRDKVTCTAPLPTKRLLIGIGRICRLLSNYEPSTREPAPPAMKLWEAVSAFREFPHVLAEVFASDTWRARYQERFSRFDELVHVQDRSALDYYLPLELTRDIARRCQGLTFSYSPESGRLHRRTPDPAEDPNAITLSALDVHDRFGGSIIEEVLEYGSAKVTDRTI
jgi:hypothetical protein